VTRRLVLVAAAGALALFLALPVATLVGRAFEGGSLAATIGSRAVREALLLSLTTTGVSLVAIVLFGTPLAFLLARRRFAGAGLVETVVDLPLVLPPSVAGLALLLVFGRRGLLGESLDGAGLAIPFTAVAVVLAQDLRRGSVLRPPRAPGSRACRATSRTPRASTAPRRSGSSGTSWCRSPPRRSQPGWS
jgi:molybdate transport system permease protein